MANIELSKDGTITLVTLNRPERRNAITLAMWQALAQLFAEIAKDQGTRIVILTGAGGNFCAGADISEFDQVRDNAERGHAYERTVDNCADAIMAAPQAVIAAVNGFCFGGGCGLAMACDFRVAGESAVFSIPAAKLSVVYGMRETQNLLALVGLPQAKRILFSAARIDAREALEIGLADEVASDALDGATTLAATMADSAPLTLAGSKMILNGLALGSFDHAAAEKAMSRALESRDYQEGRKAFREKRKPDFKGR